MAGNVWRALIFSLCMIGLSDLLAVEHVDPSGFSLTAPTDWNVVSKINQQALPANLRTWLSKNRVDLDRVSVVVLRPGMGEFLENMNVVVEPQAMPINSASIRKLLTEIPDQYKKLGVTLKDFRVSTKKYGDYETIVLDYEASMPLVPFPITQKQVFFSGGGKTYIVTCTAKNNSYAEYSAPFETVLGSMKIPAGESASSNTTVDYRASVLVAIALGMVLAVVGIVKNFMR